MCQVSRLHDPNRASYTRTTVTSSFMGRFSSNSLVPLSGRVVSHVPSFKAPRSKLSELYTKNCNFVIYGPIQLKFAGTLSGRVVSHVPSFQAPRSKQSE